MNQIAAGPTAGLPPSPGSQAGPTGSNLLGTSQAPKKMFDAMGYDESPLDI